MSWSEYVNVWAPIKVVIIIVVLLVILLLGAIAFFIIKKRRESESESSDEGYTEGQPKSEGAGEDGV